MYLPVGYYSRPGAGVQVGVPAFAGMTEEGAGTAAQDWATPGSTRVGVAPTYGNARESPGEGCAYVGLGIRRLWHAWIALQRSLW